MTSIVFVVYTLYKSNRKSKILPESPSETNPIHMVSGTTNLPRIKRTNSKANSSNQRLPEIEDLKDFPVPETVRQRKREVNAEILGLFGNESLYTNPGFYPGIYYEYKIVPKEIQYFKQNGQCEKKSMKAIKRERRKQSEKYFRQCQHHYSSPNKFESGNRCSCIPDDKHDGEWENFNNDHTSIIHIEGNSSTITTGPSKNDSTLTNNRNIENIYSELIENTEPTAV